MYAIRLKCTGTRTGSSSPCDPENNLASEKKKMKYNSNFTSAKVWVIFQNELLETLPLYNLEYEGYEGKWFERWGECSGVFFIWHVVTSNTLQTSSTYFWLTKKKISYLENQSRFTCPPWQTEWCGCRWQSLLHGVWRLWKRWLECQSFSRVMYFSKGLSPLPPPACTQKYIENIWLRWTQERQERQTAILD